MNLLKFSDIDIKKLFFIEKKIKYIEEPKNILCTVSYDNNPNILFETPVLQKIDYFLSISVFSDFWYLHLLIDEKKNKVFLDKIKVIEDYLKNDKFKKKYSIEKLSFKSSIKLFFMKSSTDKKTIKIMKLKIINDNINKPFTNKFRQYYKIFVKTLFKFKVWKNSGYYGISYTAENIFINKMISRLNKLELLDKTSFKCNICFNDNCIDKKIYNCCKQYNCKNCFTEWMKKHNTCPFCRKTIKNTC